MEEKIIEGESLNDVVRKDHSPQSIQELPITDFMDLDLKAISTYAEEISGNWDGKESGWAEERADIANDIIEKVKELRALLTELNEF